MAINHTYYPNTTTRRHCPAIVVAVGRNPTKGTCDNIWNEYVWNNGGPAWIDKSKGQRLGIYSHRIDFNALLVDEGNPWSSNPNNPNFKWDNIDRMLDCKCFTDDEDAILILRWQHIKSIPFFMWDTVYTVLDNNGKWLPAWWRQACRDIWDDFGEAFQTRYGNDTRIYGVGYEEGPAQANNNPPPDWPSGGFREHAAEYGKWVAGTSVIQPNWTHYLFQPNQHKVESGLVAAGNTGSLATVGLAHADPKMFTGSCGDQGGIGGSSEVVDCGTSDFSQHNELQQNTGVLASPEEDNRAIMMSAEPNGVRNGFTVPSSWPGGDPFSWNPGQFFSAEANTNYTKHHCWYHGENGVIPCQVLILGHGGQFDGIYNRSAADWKRALDQFGAGGTAEILPPMQGFTVGNGEPPEDVIGQVGVTLDAFYSDISGQQEPGPGQGGGPPVEVIIDNSDGGPSYVETGTFTDVGASGEITVQNISPLLTQGGTNHTIDKPENTAEGDLLLLLVAANGGASQFTTISISGWTELDQEAYEFSITGAAYWRIAGASEPTTYTYQTDVSKHTAAVIVRITDADSTTPIDVTPTVDEGFSSAPTFPAITTANDNAEVIRFVAQDQEGITIDGGYPLGHTGLYAKESQVGEALACGIAVCHITQASAGELAAIDYTSDASEQWVTMSIAIRPATGAGSGYLGNARKATAGSGTKSALYTFTNIPKTSSFDIYARWPSGVTGAATNTPYTIGGKIGQGKLRLDQNGNFDQWNLVTSYQLPVENTADITVTVDDDANGTIIVDAIRLVYSPLSGFFGVGAVTLDDFTGEATASNLLVEPIDITLDDFTSQGMGVTRGIVFPTPEGEQYPSGYSGRIISTVSFQVDVDEDEFQKFAITSKDVEFIIDRVGKGKFGKK